MPDFSVRSTQQEIMDDLSSSGSIIDQTLYELERINLLLGGNHVTINGIQRLLKGKPKDRVYTIADLGCGSGDILRLIERWAQRTGYRLQMVGIDANPNIVRYAAENTQSPNIRYQAINIFSDEFKRQQFDIVIGTLFFHHFTNEELIKFFSRLKTQVSIGIVINDIHRHWFAYHSIKWLTRGFSRSPMVINDAPLSVMRAFRKSELLAILKSVGFARYSVRWMWAFRWQVIINN